MPSNPRKRFQFTLTDLLLTAAMSGMGMAWLIPRYFEDDELAGCVMILLLTLLFTFAMSFRIEGRGRKLGIIVTCLLAWALAVGWKARHFTRIDANETQAYFACQAFIEAEEIFHRTDHDKDNVLEYAPRLGGNQSLVETVAGLGDLQLIDPVFALAEFSTPGGYCKTGYYFKVLTAQGPHAGGGKQSYLDAADNMTGGYALIAWPEIWGVKGKRTFMVSHKGVVYAAKLGPNTGSIANAVTEFDPDPAIWKPAE